ncbi:hypothetical protein ANN_26714 [Periplaneta americana]|uniref:Uncharacterized protein n=1 Tax=Periplaneta americana TaxID=6978 RepID=A0ABQ8RZD4_PERAM|nr:hypothetical protein ANN_26714 [Periplaneta americana]
MFCIINSIQPRSPTGQDWLRRGDELSLRKVATVSVYIAVYECAHTDEKVSPDVCVSGALKFRFAAWAVFFAAAANFMMAFCEKFLGYLASEWDEGDNAGEMSPGSNTERYPPFAHIGLRENPGKNLNQVTCPDRELNPGHLVSQLDVLTVTPQKLQFDFSEINIEELEDNQIKKETWCWTNKIRSFNRTELTPTMQYLWHNGWIENVLENRLLTYTSYVKREDIPGILQEMEEDEEEEEEENNKNAATKNNESDSEFSDEECEQSEHESQSELEEDEGCEHSEHESESELEGNGGTQGSVEILGCEHSQHESESELEEDEGCEHSEHKSESELEEVEGAQRIVEIPDCEHNEHESESELEEVEGAHMTVEILGCEHNEHESESELEEDEGTQGSVEIPDCEQSEHESESELEKIEGAQRSVEIPGCEHCEHESKLELERDESLQGSVVILGCEHSEHESAS